MRDIKKEHYDKFIEDSGILDWVGADENIIKHVYYEGFKDGETASKDEVIVCGKTREDCKDFHR